LTREIYEPAGSHKPRRCTAATVGRSRCSGGIVSPGRYSTYEPSSGVSSPTRRRPETVTGTVTEVPSKCLAALDDADEFTGIASEFATLTGEIMGLAAEGFFVAADGDIAAMGEVATRVDEISPQIEDLSAQVEAWTYAANAAACRAAAP
jgi:hypothetical protein